ncbi:MAG: CBS domain-containing protein [Euryarchaeota archaeon]|nr:CBS domain-containing protein [Euryarchaeota archaeon]
MKVKDMMSKGVVTVDESLSIREVAGVMARYDISGVAVVGKEGSLEGTISNRDIVEAIAEEKNIEKLRAGDLMIP